MLLKKSKAKPKKLVSITLKMSPQILKLS